MNILLALSCLASLGFCVEELPGLLRRKRLARERQALERERVEARLALAIDARWREFGCARGMTDEELARTRRATAAKYPPPVGRRVRSVQELELDDQPPPAPAPRIRG